MTDHHRPRHQDLENVSVLSGLKPSVGERVSRWKNRLELHLRFHYTKQMDRALNFSVMVRPEDMQELTRDKILSQFQELQSYLFYPEEKVGPHFFQRHIAFSKRCVPAAPFTNLMHVLAYRAKRPQDQAQLFKALVTEDILTVAEGLVRFHPNAAEIFADPKAVADMMPHLCQSPSLLKASLYSLHEINAKRRAAGVDAIDCAISDLSLKGQDREILSSVLASARAGVKEGRFNA